jgi:hypothetical protein
LPSNYAGSGAFAQTREVGWRPTAFPGHSPAVEVEEVDGAAAPQPVKSVLRTPGERLAPEIPAKLVELPPTEPRGQDGSDDSDSGYFAPAGYVEPAPEGLGD